MKKILYLVMAIIIVSLSSIYIYTNFIYYNISYNPIEEYKSESYVEFIITKNLPEGEETNVKCQDPNACKKVLEYLGSLNLKPLKDKTAIEMQNNESNTFYDGRLKFGESVASDTILISDISIDTPDIIRISSCFL